MILLKGAELGLGIVEELGIDDIRTASHQTRQRHRNIQLTFMIKGTLSWTFPDGRVIRLNGGEYCITGKGDTFDILYDVLSPCSLMWIIFDPFSRNSDTGTFFSGKELLKMGNSLAASSISVCRMNPAIHFYIREIRELVMKTCGEKISSADMQRIRVALMGVFVESANSASFVDSSSASLCAKVKALVLKQPETNLTVEEISGFFRLSPGFFGKKFRAESGVPVADFVRRVKLEEAMRLMRSESKNITETAFALGFSSSQYFATLFKKYFGRSPKQFRQETKR